MPIQNEGAEFTDVFGNVLPYYQSNAGDQITAKLSFRSAIRLSSLNNPLIFDLTLNQITSTTESWLEEGFRVGDWVWCRKYNGGGTLILQWWTQINLVDDFVCDFNVMQTAGINTANNESIVFLVVIADLSVVGRSRDDLDVLINHSVNNSTGAPESLIDGEVTRATFPGLASMIVGATVVGNLIVNQSGQFLKSAEVKRVADSPDGFNHHEITLIFINSGGYDQDWFDSGDCLKLFVKLLWASLGGEPFARSVEVYNFDSNTGGFDMPHNTSVADATLVQGITEELQYCVGANGISLKVDGPLTEIGIGCMYVPTDVNYYKNRPYSQQEITMTLRTTDVVPGFYTTEVNEFGASYTIQVTNVTNIGSVSTIIISLAFNVAFTTFMEGREEGDRLFKIWLKCGNTNFLVYSDQLTCEPVISGPLPMIQDYGYLDHSQNTTVATGDLTGFIADTEDDVAFVGSFLLEKNEVFDSFIVKLEAFDTVTEEDFTLQQQIFSFAGVQISADGRYLLDEFGTSSTVLLATSEKRQFLLVLDPSLDVGSQYGVKIYAPWLLDWKYWISKNDANVDFYPTQNENWQQYSGSANWIVRTELTLIQGNFGFVHTNTISINTYDDEPNIDGLGIELILESTLQILETAVIGELMRIRVTRENLIGNWDPSKTWAQTTIEPREGGQRWDCSSIVPFDNNSQNPLTPESTNLMMITYPLPNVAVFECLFDTNKIDMSNGISITGKIKENDDSLLPYIITDNKDATTGLSVRRVASVNVYALGLPCMRVRRISDDAEQDIGFVGDDLDTASLLAFVGTGPTDQGHVAIWYSQDGIGLNAVQTTRLAQPRIVINGAVNLATNGIPAINFGGIRHFFDLSDIIIDTQLFFESFVFERLGTDINGIIVSLGSVNGPYSMFWNFEDKIFTGMGANNELHAVDQLQTGMFHNVLKRDLTNTVELYQNTAPLPFLNYVRDTPVLTTLGKNTILGVDQYQNGNMQEVLFWNLDKTNDMNFININTESYYDNY